MKNIGSCLGESIRFTGLKITQKPGMVTHVFVRSTWTAEGES